MKLLLTSNNRESEILLLYIYIYNLVHISVGILRSIRGLIDDAARIVP